MWPHPQVVELVTTAFVPVRVHVRDDAAEFRRLGQKYDAQWTPMILLLDFSGEERHRVEGFVPVPELLAQLEFGLGRIAFARAGYDDAERHFRHVAQSGPDTEIAPEALYWAGVARYKSTDDGETLRETASAIGDRYPRSIWAQKASVWR